MVADYDNARKEGADEDGFYELTVMHHKTSSTSGPLNVYLDLEVSDVGKPAYRLSPNVRITLIFMPLFYRQCRN
jgi:hypothetical protein